MFGARENSKVGISFFGLIFFSKEKTVQAQQLVLCCLIDFRSTINNNFCFFTFHKRDDFLDFVSFLCLSEAETKYTKTILIEIL